MSETITRRRPDRWEHWHNLVELQQLSGLKVKSFCVQQDIDPSSFYSWRNKLGMNPKSPVSQDDFVEIVVTPGAQAGSGVSIDFADDVRVQVDRGFDCETLKSVLDLLRTA